jgi:hypothetical protein
MLGLFGKKSQPAAPPRLPPYPDDERALRVKLAQVDFSARQLRAKAIKRMVGAQLTLLECDTLAQYLKIALIFRLDAETGRANASRARVNCDALTSSQFNQIYALISGEPELSLASVREKLSRIERKIPDVETTTPPAPSEDNRSTVFLNAETAGSTARLVRANERIEVLLAALTMLFLIAKQGGWTGGNDFFQSSNGTISFRAVSGQLSEREARSLYLELKPGLEQADDSPEAAQLKELVEFIGRGAFKIFVGDRAA